MIRQYIKKNIDKIKQCNNLLACILFLSGINTFITEKIVNIIIPAIRPFNRFAKKQNVKKETISNDIIIIFSIKRSLFIFTTYFLKIFLNSFSKSHHNNFIYSTSFIFIKLYNINNIDVLKIINIVYLK